VRATRPVSGSAEAGGPPSSRRRPGRLRRRPGMGPGGKERGDSPLRRGVDGEVIGGRTATFDADEVGWPQGDLAKTAAANFWVDVQVEIPVDSGGVRG